MIKHILKHVSYIFVGVIVFVVTGLVVFLLRKVLAMCGIVNISLGIIYLIMSWGTGWFMVDAFKDAKMFKWITRKIKK